MGYILCLEVFSANFCPMSVEPDVIGQITQTVHYSRPRFWSNWASSGACGVQNAYMWDYDIIYASTTWCVMSSFHTQYRHYMYSSVAVTCPFRAVRLGWSSSFIASIILVDLSGWVFLAESCVVHGSFALSYYHHHVAYYAISVIHPSHKRSQNTLFFNRYR